MRVMPKILLFVTTIMLMSCAYAVKDKSSKKEAFKACAEEQGIHREKGKRLTREERQKMKTCLEGKGISREEMKEGRRKMKGFKKAIKACAEENNLKRPEKGEEPSEQERAIMKACLEKKGFKKPSKE